MPAKALSRVTKPTLAGAVIAGQQEIRRDATGTVAAAPFGDFGANGALLIAGATNTAQRMSIGIATADTGTPGVIQAIWAGTLPLSLALNPSGGNVGVGVLAPGAKLDVGGPIRPASYTVATLPTAGVAGRVAWASNGRAYNGGGTLEAAGAGTGCLVTDNGSAWRVAGTNQTVQA